MYVDIELDLVPGFGWQGGPFFRTRIKTLQNGHERRTVLAACVRHRYSLPFNNIKEDNYREELKGFFLAMNGSANSFKIRDRSDYQATFESLGNAPTGTTPVQLQKVSTYGVASYIRRIEKPKAGSITVYQDTGSGPVSKPGTLDVLTGQFTPSTSWTGGSTLTWSGEFYVPVRFDSDELLMSIDNKSSNDFIMNGSVDLIEVFGE